MAKYLSWTTCTSRRTFSRQILFLLDLPATKIDLEVSVFVLKVCWIEWWVKAMRPGYTEVLMTSETEYAFPSLDMAHNEIYILWGIYSIATIQQNE